VSGCGAAAGGTRFSAPGVLTTRQVGGGKAGGRVFKSTPSPLLSPQTSQPQPQQQPPQQQQ
jgi:hypothetical protein